MFVTVSNFPSCTTPVFPAFSLVQVMFGSGWPDALQVNCKLLPSRTVGLPLIPVIFIGTTSNQTVTSKSRIIEWHVHAKATIAKKIILLTWFLNVLREPCTCKWNSYMLWLCRLYKISPWIMMHYEHFIMHKCLPSEIWWIFKRPRNFSELFSQLKLSIIIFNHSFQKMIP